MEADREMRAQTETRIRRKPTEVPSRVARVKAIIGLVVRAAIPALEGKGKRQ